MIDSITEIYWIVSDASHQSYLRLEDERIYMSAASETVMPLRAAKFYLKQDAYNALAYHRDFCEQWGLDRVLTVTTTISFREQIINDASNQHANQNVAV